MDNEHNLFNASETSKLKNLENGPPMAEAQVIEKTSPDRTEMEALEPRYRRSDHDTHTLGRRERKLPQQCRDTDYHENA